MGSLVSLVMTDIVDSTRRWNAAEGAMAADLELHDRLIRDVVEGAGGSVFKHTGDGMIAVFDDPVAAVGAAASIQQAIGAALWQQPEGLRVRAAVHTGVVYPRDGDLFGTAVNKVARLLGVCPPGAVLVSGATTGLLTDRAPEGLTLQPIGPVSLAGFATPDDTHALVGAGLAEVPAAVTDSPGPVVHGVELPPIHDELVGRGDELAAIWDALGRWQLLSLVGVGGMGKTRLALEVASGAVAAYDGGVWWIDLANATSGEAVVPVAMAAVGARETPGRTAVQAFCDRFAGVTGLVVVDNCEHVHGAARSLVDALRTAVPGIKLVCTSREALGLRGEHIVPIGSLPTGDGVALFCERALAVQHDVDVRAELSTIERICARLDGIPLAVELAAARCRSMTPTEIDELLDDRFRLLRGGREGAERHRTLQAAVAWSYSLLDTAERVVFDQMAVFAGGTLIDGLVAVTGIERLDLLDVVERLIARSMVTTTRTSLGTRYHQLETLRQFAEDRLVEAGTIGEVRDRHLDWTLALTSRLAAALGVEAEAAAFARFDVEVDNLRVAVAHALDANRHEMAYRAVNSVALLALYSLKLDVLDWVRPFPTGHVWTRQSAGCAAHGHSADTMRGRGPVRAESVDDVPAWYPVAAVGAKTSFVGMHLISGGDWRVALELLDSCQPISDVDSVRVDGYRLMAHFFRWMGLSDDESDLGDVTELAASTVAIARRSGSVMTLAFAAMTASFALCRSRPELAVAYANEALDLADLLGADYLSGLAESALGSAMTTTPTYAVLVDLRSRADTALGTKMFHSAGVAALTAIAPIAAVAPEVALRFWAVWKREFGLDGRGYLDGAGLSLPEDLDRFQRDVAGLSLTEAIRDVIAALDRVIAAAESAEGGES
jgi:predicted ATPase/class 3 adenylate cyclase